MKESIINGSAEHSARSAFYRTHEKQLREILSRYRSWLLDDVLPFWEDRVVDREYGGYLNCYNRYGELTKTCKPGWFVGRDMYLYSLLYTQIAPEAKWLEIASVGRSYLDGPFCEGGGRFHQMMDREGRVLSGFTSIFTDHFAAKGLFAWIEAAGLKEDPKEIALARQVMEQLLSDIEDPQVLRIEHVAPGTMKHAISFMTLAVALESRHIFGSQYDEVIRCHTDRILRKFAKDEYRALFETVRTDGTPTLSGSGRIFDAGHSMESIWFAMQAGEELGEEGYYSRAGEIFDWVWEKSWDERYGGFYTWTDALAHEPEEGSRCEIYTDYPVFWDDKIWWTHAEGLNAAISAALYGEEERALQRFLQIDEYVTAHFRDPEYGEWYSILDRGGAVKADCKGFESKGPYHVPRTLVHVIRMIERYLEGTLAVQTASK